MRWRIALPFALISGLFLIMTALGAWLYWSTDNSAERALTVFLCVMYGICLAVSVSIGLDRRIQRVPWLRMGTVALFIVLSIGVGWVRDMV
jgi:hypothetical protein